VLSCNALLISRRRLETSNSNARKVSGVEIQRKPTVLILYTVESCAIGSWDYLRKSFDRPICLRSERRRLRIERRFVIQILRVQ
jgi:hypothetical protein